MFDALFPLVLIPFYLIWLVVCLKDNMPYGCTKHRISLIALSILIIVTIAIAFWGLYVHLRPSIIIQNPAVSHTEPQADLYYAVGYDAALHGNRPNSENVRCYQCGYSGSEYPDNIHFFEIATFWVPICDYCISSASPDNPILFMGEGYTFIDAKAE